MRGVTPAVAVACGVIVGVAWFAEPAVANTQVKNVFHVDFRYSEKGTCGFKIYWHAYGSYKSVDYYDDSGSLYKSIDTPGGGGPFTQTATAHGTTLVQQSEAYSVVITYGADGTATYTQRGPYDRFTTPGGGIVLLDAGILTVTEPDEVVLFEGGPHEAANGDFDAFCAAFD